MGPDHSDPAAAVAQAVRALAEYAASAGFPETEEILTDILASAYGWVVEAPPEEEGWDAPPMAGRWPFPGRG